MWDMFCYNFSSPESIKEVPFLGWTFWFRQLFLVHPNLDGIVNVSFSSYGSEVIDSIHLHHDQKLSTGSQYGIDILSIGHEQQVHTALTAKERELTLSYYR